jgi:hypothetical protein
VFDTETTTDFTQRLLFGVFRLYVHGSLDEEGLFLGDSLTEAQGESVRIYGELHGLRVYTRSEFVEQVFHAEIYILGALCCCFNTPFDISRIAMSGNGGRGKHRRTFRFRTSRRMDIPDIRVQAISARAAFIGFAPKKKLQDWEKPFFAGRFLDVSALATALTGERFSLKRAALEFQTEHRKTETKSLGRITEETLDYGRADVLVTWALFEKLKAEYLKYPFATLENERKQAPGTLPYTKLYSTASTAKALLKLVGFSTHQEQTKDLDSRILGYAMSAYFGGRSEVRVRRTDVPVRVVDFTSMYPSVFVLQNLQELLAAKRLRSRDATDRIRDLLRTVGLEQLYDPNLWPQLRCIVRLKPNGDTLPVRMRLDPTELAGTGNRSPSAAAVPYTIAVTPFTSSSDRWYSLADVIAAKLLGNTVPEIEEAVEFYGEGLQDLRPVEMLGVTLDPKAQIFKTVVEQRQRYKEADPTLAQALKILANSGAYGIYAEINVSPPAESHKTGPTDEDGPHDDLARPASSTGPKTQPVAPKLSTWYADIGPVVGETRDERAGEFFNPPIASLVTGAARLMLGMAEAEVANRGGTYAFCDTDSLAIVAGSGTAEGVPVLTESAVLEIIGKFNRLNPYDPEVVPNLLKLEYPGIRDLHCWAVSAKRYVLFSRDRRNRIRIVKASESGLGATLGRSDGETVGKLARRMWTDILLRELRIAYRESRRKRMRLLTDFDLPMRRRLPITQPHVHKAPGFNRFNRTKSYDFKIKPFGFLQAITPAMRSGKNAVQPIAPFERDARESRNLAWTDFRTGDSVRLDWDGNAYRGTVPVMRLREFVDRHERHPESKAAGSDGLPATEETRGILGRLNLYDGPPQRIGKEVDRLSEDEDYLLDATDPTQYLAVEHTLEWALGILEGAPATEIAPQIPMSEKRFRDIRSGVAEPNEGHRSAIIRIAKCRENESGA